MTASYTENLRITKQGDNDNPNTWGDVVNNQVIELIEKAIAGVEAVNVTGSSNITLTSINGGDDQSRNAVLELSGAITTNIDVIVPAVEKIYIIKTTHTGGTVRVIPSGGSVGIDFETGDFGIVYTNGTTITNVTQGVLFGANNLSDLADAGTARTNLGLGDIAPLNAGSGLTINGSDLDVDAQSSVTAGDVKYTGGATTSSGWYTCDGQALSRTTHSALFTAIGVTYGVGDGSTTFNVPDAQGRSAIGAGSGTSLTTRAAGATGGTEDETLTSSQIPAHNHDLTLLAVRGDHNANPSQARWGGDNISAGNQTATTSNNTGGGSSHNNTHPFWVPYVWIFSGV